MNNSFEKIKEIFSKYLSEKGYRKTPERFAILKEIYRCEGHFDIDSLFVSMKSKNYRVSRATLYNTIELLLDSNLVRKHQFGKNQSQFEKCFENRQHDHLICISCNKVLEFCDPSIQSIKESAAKATGFQIIKHSLHLYGYCNSCKKNNETDKL